MSDYILSAKNVSKRFGGLLALNNVSLEVEKGQIYGLIGPNGAGKTTFFNVITGLYKADGGDFNIADKKYCPSQAHFVATYGISRTFQNIRLFSQMTVLENVMVGRHVKSRSGIFDAILKTSFFKKEEKEIKEKAMELLKYIGLDAYAHYISKSLSYGDQRRLEIARALATDPIVIALDEPAAGMNATEKNVLRDLIYKIREDGKTILLIEHDVKLVLGLCDKLSVLDYGKIISVGSPSHIQNDKKVIEAYLGASPE